jgi:hypothetical protein
VVLVLKGRSFIGEEHQQRLEGDHRKPKKKDFNSSESSSSDSDGELVIIIKTYTINDFHELWYWYLKGAVLLVKNTNKG